MLLRITTEFEYKGIFSQPIWTQAFFKVNIRAPDTEDISILGR